MFFHGDWICSLFLKDSDADVIRLGHYYLKVVSIFYVMLAMIFVYRNAIQGMGGAMTPVVTSSAEIVARVVMAVFGVRFLGYLGVCMCDAFAWIVAALMLMPVFYYQIHKTIKRGLAEKLLMRHRHAVLPPEKAHS